MKTIGVGLIGYGLGGRAFHAPFVNHNAGMTLRAVVSSSPTKVHAHLPETLVVSDVAQLLAEPDIDLVIVASPDEFHAPHATAALEAGKHVLVDKPFATSLVDAQKVARLAQDSDLVLTVFQNRRWDSDFRTLRRLIGEGVLGDIVQFESHLDRWRPQHAAVWKEARMGGSWTDLGPHLLDQAVCLFGRPEAMTLDLATLRSGAPASDYFHAILRYPDRRIILHSNKLCASNGLRFAVHGTNGSWIKHGLDPQEAASLAGKPLEGDDWGYDPVPGVLTRGDADAPGTVVANERGDYRLFFEALASAIRNEGPNPVPAQEALVIMELLEAGMESAREHREIRL